MNMRLVIRSQRSRQYLARIPTYVLDNNSLYFFVFNDALLLEEDKKKVKRIAGILVVINLSWAQSRDAYSVNVSSAFADRTDAEDLKE